MTPGGKVKDARGRMQSDKKSATIKAAKAMPAAATEPTITNQAAEPVADTETTPSEPERGELVFDSNYLRSAVNGLAADLGQDISVLTALRDHDWTGIGDFDQAVKDLWPGLPRRVRNHPPDVRLLAALLSPDGDSRDALTAADSERESLLVVGVE